MTSQAVTLPAPNQRTLVVGRTGSGKTVAAIFLFSQMDFDVKPWIIIDFKGDENLNSIQGAEYLRPDGPLNLKPGVYILRLRVDQKAEMEAFLWSCYYRENIGLFVDEGYMLGQGAAFSPAFRAILTQGRSKNMGVIINSQRPVWLDMFSKSEANKIVMFHLNFAGDRKVMGEIIGDKGGPDIHARLAPYHSIYYDVDSNTAVELSPVPSPDESLTLINRRLVLIHQRREVPVANSTRNKNVVRI